MFWRVKNFFNPNLSYLSMEYFHGIITNHNGFAAILDY